MFLIFFISVLTIVNPMITVWLSVSVQTQSNWDIVCRWNYMFCSNEISKAMKLFENIKFCRSNKMLILVKKNLPNNFCIYQNRTFFILYNCPFCIHAYFFIRTLKMKWTKLKNIHLMSMLILNLCLKVKYKL